MGNTFKIERTPEGTDITIKSEKIEKLFKSMAREGTGILPLQGTNVGVWWNDAVDRFINSMHTMFINQQATVIRSGNRGTKDIDMLVPTGRTDHLFHNNQVGIRCLMAVGIGQGKVFRIPGMYSQDTLEKVALGYKRCMEYLLKDAVKPVVYKFEIFEDGEKEKPAEILEFTTV